MQMNGSELTFVLGVVAALQIKHLVCDGPLQTLAMVNAKRVYGAPLGLAHALIHGAGTAVVLLAVVPSAGFALALAALDAVIHYHVDFSKENLLRNAGLTTKDSAFWWAYCADQTVHQLTYLLLVWLAFKP